MNSVLPCEFGQVRSVFPVQHCLILLFKQAMMRCAQYSVVKASEGVYLTLEQFWKLAPACLTQIIICRKRIAIHKANVQIISENWNRSRSYSISLTLYLNLNGSKFDIYISLLLRDKQTPHTVRKHFKMFSN